LTPRNDFTAEKTTGGEWRAASGERRAAELNLAAGNLRSAEDHARRALTADEWSEPAHRILIAAALARGDRSGAARALMECEKMLDRLGVRPDPQTQMLRRHIFDAAPTASGSRPTHTTAIEIVAV